MSSKLSTWATRRAHRGPQRLVAACPTDVAAQRLQRPTDRMERLGKRFHRRVTEGFAALAERDPTRWIVVDGVGTIDEVGQRVNAAYDKWVAAMKSTDTPVASLFDGVVGQERAVEFLRDVRPRTPCTRTCSTAPTARAPRNAARGFAAALLCPNGGCGECSTCRRALAATASRPRGASSERRVASSSTTRAR